MYFSKKTVSLSIIFIILNALFPNLVFANDNCRFYSGTSYETILRKGGEAIAYQISVSGDNWHLNPFGWHATAVISRQQSKDGMANTANGLVNIHARKSRYEVPSATYSIQSRKPLEVVGYPHTAIGAETIELMEEYQNYNLGGLVGVAKIYAFKMDSPFAKKAFKDEIESGKSAGLLSISVSDECAELSTTIAYIYKENLLYFARSYLDELQSRVIVETRNLGAIDDLDLDQ